MPDDRDPARPSLTRRAVLGTAVELADRDGLDALTMRGLARELGVEAMSLYHHVASKEDVLDGVAELVVGEILDAVRDLPAPPDAEQWRQALRSRILAARAVLLRHRWAPRVLETRTSLSPPVVAYYDGVLGIMRAGGFSWDLAHHAVHALGSRALGFSQELFTIEGGGAADGSGAAVEAMIDQLAERHPHLAGMVAAIAHDDPGTTLGWCDDQAEFEFGLDVVLEGLDRARGRN